MRTYAACMLAVVLTLGLLATAGADTDLYYKVTADPLHCGDDAPVEIWSRPVPR